MKESKYKLDPLKTSEVCCINKGIIKFDKEIKMTTYASLCG